MERRFDELGRISVPVEMRRALGLTPGARVDLKLQGNKIIVTKSKISCTFCGCLDEIKDVKGVRVCQSCIDEIKVGHFWEVK